MARHFWFAVLGLMTLAGMAAADEGLEEAIALAKKAGGLLRTDSASGLYEHLFLDNASTTDADVAAVVDAIKKAQPQSKVPIRQVFLGPNITDESVKKITELKGLSFICIRRSKVTDKGLAELKKLPNLMTLRANDTAITDEGLKHLAEVKSIQQLLLNNTNITDGGLKHLTRLNLVTLDVKGTKVTEAGARLFREGVVGR